MDFKPSDFFLAIVDFLGVLVPGAVLVYLQAEWICRIFDVSPLQAHWIVFAVAAYLLGHLLLALTDLLEHALNELLPFMRKIRLFPKLHEEAERLEKKSVPFLRSAATSGAATAFHAALSFLRLKHPEAAAELDRHMASYKLLRSLVAVFLFDLVFSIPVWHQTRLRLVVDFSLTLVFFLAFARMRQLAYLLAFQYCILIREQEPILDISKMDIHVS